jgi:hypothetical protein
MSFYSDDGASDSDEPNEELYYCREWKCIQSAGDGYSPRTGHTVRPAPKILEFLV